MDSNMTFKAVAGGKTFVTLVAWKRSLPSVTFLMDDKFGFEETRLLAPFTWKHFFTGVYGLVSPHRLLGCCFVIAYVTDKLYSIVSSPFVLIQAVNPFALVLTLVALVDHTIMFCPLMLI